MSDGGLSVILRKGDYESAHYALALVSAADHMANHLQTASHPTGYDPTANAALPVLTKLWSPGRREHLIAALPEMMITAAEAAGRPGPYSDP